MKMPDNVKRFTQKRRFCHYFRKTQNRHIDDQVFGIDCAKRKTFRENLSFGNLITQNDSSWLRFLSLSSGLITL